LLIVDKENIDMPLTKLTGDPDYVFGIDDESQEVEAIIVESYSKETTVEFEAEAKDDTGNTACVVRGPLKHTFNFSGYCKSGKLLTAFSGSNCKVSFKDAELGNIDEAFVEKFGINASNTDFKKAELTAVFYPDGKVCCAD
jgi:hypothetical protein